MSVRVPRALLAIALVFSLSACGTLFDTLGDAKSKHSDPRKNRTTNVKGGKVRIYGGLRWDLEVLNEGRAGWMLFFFALDVPLSAAVDTVLLPFTIPYNIFK